LRHHATHHAIVKTVRQAIVLRQLQGFDVTICLMNAADAQQYNTDFRHKDYATNILTFPLNASWRGNRQYLNADIIICTDVVLREATEQGKTPGQHLAHLLVHGTLHAQGFDHEIDSEADIMEALEIKILQSLSIENPYLSLNLQ
jgi:probable rRNA maturation factor